MRKLLCCLGVLLSCRLASWCCRTLTCAVLLCCCHELLSCRTAQLRQIEDMKADTPLESLCRWIASPVYDCF